MSKISTEVNFCKCKGKKLEENESWKKEIFLTFYEHTNGIY